MIKKKNIFGSKLNIGIIATTATSAAVIIPLVIYLNHYKNQANDNAVNFSIQKKENEKQVTKTIDLENQKDDLENQKEKLVSSQNQIYGNLENKTKLFDDLKEKHELLNNEKLELEKNKKQLEKTKIQLLSNNQSLKNKVDDLKNNKKLLEKDKKELEETKTLLDSIVNNKDTKIMNLGKMVSTKESEIENSEKRIQTHKNYLKAIEARLKEWKAIAELKNNWFNSRKNILSGLSSLQKNYIDGKKQISTRDTLMIKFYIKKMYKDISAQAKRLVELSKERKANQNQETKAEDKPTDKQ